jgi:hypothetical protein
MGHVERIYYICPSSEQGRPQIDLESDSLAGIIHDWTEWNYFHDDFPIDSEVVVLRNLSFKVDREDALNWDWYSIGFWGMISQRAKDLLWPYAGKHLRCLQTTLNGEPYYILHLDKRLALDCLDLQKSKIEYFKCDPDDIKDIKKYTFQLEMLCDPLVFHVPQAREILGTQSIKRMVEETDLKGFHFEDVEHLNR